MSITVLPFVLMVLAFFIAGIGILKFSPHGDVEDLIVPRRVRRIRHRVQKARGRRAS